MAAKTVAMEGLGGAREGGDEEEVVERRKRGEEERALEELRLDLREKEKGGGEDRRAWEQRRGEKGESFGREMRREAAIVTGLCG